MKHITTEQREVLVREAVAKRDALLAGCSNGQPCTNCPDKALCSRGCVRQTEAATPAASVPAGGWHQFHSIDLPADFFDDKPPLPPLVQPSTGGVERITWPKEKRVGRREDMSPDGTLIVGLDSDNDVYIEVSGQRHGEWQSAVVEFCNGGGGGGQSSRTRAALINLMTAIEADNAERPYRAFPPITQTNSQGGAA